MAGSDEAEASAELLRASPLFADVANATLVDLANRAVARTFRKGQVVFFEGDAGDALHVLTSGSVKVSVSSPDGSEMVLATLRAPEVFGELSVVDGGPRSASVTALETTTAISVDRDAVLATLHGQPDAVDGLLRALGLLVRRANEQATDLVFLDLAGRVAKTLTRLAERDGVERDDLVVLDLPITQTELAEMVGGSRQSVNQILKTFEARGFIAMSGREIAISDVEALARRGSM